MSELISDFESKTPHLFHNKPVLHNGGVANDLFTQFQREINDLMDSGFSTSLIKGSQKALQK